MSKIAYLNILPIKSVKRFLNFEISRFFSIFKMAAVCNLGFSKSQNFIGWWVQRAEMHHRTKFQQNWSILCGYIAPVRFFKMRVVCHLAFLKFKCFRSVVAGPLFAPAKQISRRVLSGLYQCSMDSKIGKFEFLACLAWKRLFAPPKLGFLGNLTP